MPLKLKTLWRHIIKLSEDDVRQPYFCSEAPSLLHQAIQFSFILGKRDEIFGILPDNIKAGRSVKYIYFLRNV